MVMYQSIIVTILREVCRAILVKLRRLGAAGERRRRGVATRDCHCHCIEVADADLALMASCGISVCLGCELGFLQFAICRHPAVAVLVRELEHREIEAVKTGQSDELEPVAHSRDIALKACELLDRKSV